MFNAGDLIKDKNTNIRGAIERMETTVSASNTNRPVSFTFWVQWEYMQSGTKSYTFYSMSAAETLWELDGGHVPTQNPLLSAWQQMKKDNEHVPFKEPIFTECQHEWQDYTGLMQSYKFCKKCDIKQ